MNNTSAHGPQAFFRDLRAAFGHTLQDTANGPNVDSTLQQAWDSFDGNVAIQCEGQPPIACHKGCPSCCTLRVGVLAPEVFMVAAYLRATAAALQSHGINLVARVPHSPDSPAGLPGSCLIRQACLRRSGGRTGGDPLAAAAMDAQQRDAMAAWFDETAKRY